MTTKVENTEVIVDELLIEKKKRDNFKKKLEILRELYVVRMDAKKLSTKEEEILLRLLDKANVKVEVRDDI